VARKLICIAVSQYTTESLITCKKGKMTANMRGSKCLRVAKEYDLCKNKPHILRSENLHASANVLGGWVAFCKSYI